jgi:hypothetical protein
MEDGFHRNKLLDGIHSTPFMVPGGYPVNQEWHPAL